MMRTRCRPCWVVHRAGSDSLIDDPYGVGGRAVPFYDQTLAEVISRVRAADDWNDDSVDVSNFHVRISVSVVPMLGGNPASDDLDLSEVGLLEQMAPAFFHLRAQGIDVEALWEPATAWLRAADVMGTSQRVGDILTQVADAVSHEDPHFLIAEPIEGQD